jgi:asparagine synthase (glutamine-hydrolysing)
LASGLVRTALDYEAIDSFLTFGFFPGPRTPLADVSKLMPGQRIVVADGAVSIAAYWRYPRPAPDPLMSINAASVELLDRLEEAVRMRLMGDVPVGAMLSGGLDSSLIVALMARNTAGSVKTFSVAFADVPVANELSDARRVADRYGTDHHELTLSLEDERINIENLVWHLDEPLADLSAIGFHALCRLASDHVTVALTGQGADELLGGYRKHRAASLVGVWRKLPSHALWIGNSVVLRGPKRFRRAAGALTASDAAERLLAMSGKLDPSLRGLLFRGPLADVSPGTARQVVLDRLDGLPDDPLLATLFIDGQLALVDDMLHYVDRTSMAHSLETREPYLDHRFVEFCATIPASMKLRGLTGKYVLRRIARDLLPHEIVSKPKVGLFNAAVNSWFEAHMQKAIHGYLLQTEPAYAEFLDPTQVRALVEWQTTAPNKVVGQLLLSIVMLEVWLTSSLPRMARAGVSTRPRVAV